MICTPPENTWCTEKSQRSPGDLVETALVLTPCPGDSASPGCDFAVPHPGLCSSSHIALRSVEVPTRASNTCKKFISCLCFLGEGQQIFPAGFAEQGWWDWPHLAGIWGTGQEGLNKNPKTTPAPLPLSPELAEGTGVTLGAGSGAWGHCGWAGG